MIEVLKPGLLSSVQDLGRVGFRHQGIVQAGVLDPLALKLGNILLGNPEDYPAIEVTMGNAAFRFLKSTHFVLMGSSLGARLNDKIVDSGWVYRAREGEVLTFRGSAAMLRSYFCVEGGVSVSEVLGSASTDLQARFGGFAGRALAAGDVVALGTASDNNELNVGAFLPPYSKTIRVLKGPQFDLLSDVQKQRFFTADWHVQLTSNRMGARLNSDTHAEFAHTHRLVSTAVHPGIIQLTPSGEPIVLLADCQTTGGYPIVAQVINADLRHFAQLGTNARLTLQLVDFDAALSAQRKHQLHLQQFRIALHNKKNDERN
jgi:biotin-dependent carboxylase-like uncharacterized protein